MSRWWKEEVQPGPLVELPYQGSDSLWHCPLCPTAWPSPQQLAGHIMASKGHDELKPWAATILAQRFPGSERLGDIHRHIGDQ